MAAQVPAGWYDDPGGSGGQRYWGGDNWTEHLRASPAEPAIADLPPPSGTPVDDAGLRAAGGEAPTRRSKRGPLLAAAVGVALLAVGVVVAVAFRSGPAGVVAGDRLADLSDRPEIAWSVASSELIDDLLVRLDQLALSDPWMPTAQEVRDGGSAYLSDNGTLQVWSTGGDIAAVQPTVYDVPGPLQGIDTATGERLWSTGMLLTPGEDDGWFFCEVATDERAVCLSTAARDDVGTAQRAYLRFVSLLDGSVVHEEEATRRDAVNGMVAGPYGALLITATDRYLGLTRYDLDGELLWEQQVDGDGRYTWPRVVADLVMLDRSGTDFPGAVLDLQSGEPLREYLTPGSRDGLRSTYHDWGGVLMREEHRQSAEATTVAQVDADGQERWRTAYDGALLQPPSVEHGGPLLLRDEDGRAVWAVDPADGEELWRVVLSGESVRANLVSARHVVLTDDREIIVFDASTGERRWSQPHSFQSFQRPVYIGESLVYVLEDGYRLSAHELSDGELRWSWVAPDGPGSARLVDVGGSILLVRNEVLHRLR